MSHAATVFVTVYCRGLNSMIVEIIVAFYKVSINHGYIIGLSRSKTGVAREELSRRLKIQCND